MNIPWTMMALVAAGGATGALGRYSLGMLLSRWLGHAIPYATLSVNIIGSLLMGLLIGIMAKWLPPAQPQWHALLAIGFLGSFTTFSTFSLDVVTLLQRGDIPIAVGYILASILLSIAALCVGLWLVRLVA